MKKFIFEFSNLSLISLTVFSGIYIFSLIISRQKVEFDFPSKPIAVVMGHSHPECAFDDEILSLTKNLASSGESYFYTFLKFKKVIENNPSIKFAFIEFTNNQILPNKDEWIYNGEQITYRFVKYAPYMGFKEHLAILENNPQGYINGLSLSIKDNLTSLFEKNQSFSRMGGYHSLNNISTEIKDKDNEPITSKSIRQDDVCETNLEYLEKLLAYCKNKNVTPILIRSPLHPSYPKFHNEPQFQRIRNKRFGEVRFLDFSEFALADSDYADLEHLNHKGARKFTNWFNISVEDTIQASVN
ncbi:hypothetical protein SAMN03097699_0169 [Flavobacteriaceae bacterium MAR_2010_188]|nr:hypothetical protein SAMN03097699_0169 [Flavobacteriaceae bacterium MAR_2010_188]